MTNQNSSTWSVEQSSANTSSTGLEPAPVPLSEQDIEYLNKRRQKGFKVSVYFTIIFVIIGIIWSLGSGYYEPLILAGGAILLTLSIWLFVRKSFIKELNLKLKLVYKGKVKKSTHTSGTGKSKTTYYYVKIGDFVVPNMDLYSSFADNDEVEVHLSWVKRIILKKEIVKGTGNLEYNEVLKKVELPEDAEFDEFLTDDEIICLKTKRAKNTRNFLYSLIVIPIAIASLELFFWFVEMNFWRDRLIIESIMFAAMLFFYSIGYYSAIFRISKDLKINKKKILHTIIIDKERKTYSGATDYIIKTPKKDLSVSYAGFNMFENHEKIAVHLTSYRKKVCIIESRDKYNKIYKIESFFKYLQDKNKV